MTPRFRIQLLRIHLLTIALLAVGGCGATVGKTVGGVPNLATVDSGAEAIYRGGQPSQTGFRTLKHMGVKTVINVRNDPVPWEQAAVTKHGMTYVNVPSSAERTSDNAVAAFLAAMRTAEHPVYVHCKRGRDRAGLAVACYRLVHQRDEWTRQQAIDDLRRHGHQRLLFPAVERYLRTFNPDDFMPVAPKAIDTDAGG